MGGRGYLHCLVEVAVGGVPLAVGGGREGEGLAHGGSCYVGDELHGAHGVASAVNGLELVVGEVGGYGDGGEAGLVIRPQFGDDGSLSVSVGRCERLGDGGDLTVTRDGDDAHVGRVGVVDAYAAHQTGGCSFV